MFFSGLEKMEKEKQKQLERERERVEREEYLSRKKEETEGAIKLLQESGLPQKSKFVSIVTLLLLFIFYINLP